MQLPKTSLNIAYVEPKIKMDAKERKQKLTSFVSLFASVGFKDLALNKNSTITLDKCYK